MAHAPMLTCTHMQVLYGGYVEPRCHKQARRPCGQPGARRRDDDQLLQQLRCDQADQRTSTMLPRSPKQSKLHLPCKCYYDNNTTCRSTPTRRMTQAGVVDAPAPLYRPIDRRGHGSRRRQRHLHLHMHGDMKRGRLNWRWSVSRLVDVINQESSEAREPRRARRPSQIAVSRLWSAFVRGTYIRIFIKYE